MNSTQITKSYNKSKGEYRSH